MDGLAPEISNFIIDLVALDRSSLIQLSSVSQVFRRRLAPQIFRALSIKNILRGENFNGVCDRLDRLLKFAKTSKWSVCVESMEFEIRLPDMQEMTQPGPESLYHDMKVPDLISSSFVWYPERLTYILSNLSSLFPSAHTLKIGFPGTILDCDDTSDIFANERMEVDMDSYHHILIKLLDLTFEAVGKNRREERLGQIGMERPSSENNERSFHQCVKHFSISKYPPFGCDALLSVGFQKFLSDLVSFSLELCEDYETEGTSYVDGYLRDFLDEIIPQSFLSPLYIGKSLESLSLTALELCCFGATEDLNLEPRRMGSLKKLELKCLSLTYETSISSKSGLAAFIKANGSTLEEIELSSAGWVLESFERGSNDHWASFWKSLQENQPIALQRLQIDDYYIDKGLQKSHPGSPELGSFSYVREDPSFGYTQYDDDEVPQFRKEEDFKQWFLLCNSIFGSQND